jgi:hypothetical protein
MLWSLLVKLSICIRIYIPLYIFSLLCRTVKNLNTRIDVSVPKVEKAANPRDVKRYYVLVVTKLVNVKTGEFSSDDVVQFIVPTTFESFETLHGQLTEQFPQYKQKLPPLPRKAVLFMSNDTISDRRAAFDELLKFVSKTEKLARSVAFYDFLGIDPLGDKTYVKKRDKWLEEQRTKKKKEENFTEDNLFTGDKGHNKDETDDLLDDPELFGGVLDSEPVGKTYQLASVLDETLPTEGEEGGEEREMSPEVAELLKVQSTMEDVLKLTAPKRDTSLVGSKAVKPTKESQQEATIDVAGMDKSAILSYIASNMASNDDNDDDVDLF